MVFRDGGKVIKLVIASVPLAMVLLIWTTSYLGSLSLCYAGKKTIFQLGSYRGSVKIILTRDYPKPDSSAIQFRRTTSDRSPSSSSRPFISMPVVRFDFRSGEMRFDDAPLRPKA